MHQQRCRQGVVAARHRHPPRALTASCARGQWLTLLHGSSTPAPTPASRLNRWDQPPTHHPTHQRPLDSQPHLAPTGAPDMNYVKLAAPTQSAATTPAPKGNQNADGALNETELDTPALTIPLQSSLSNFQFPPNVISVLGTGFL